MGDTTVHLRPANGPWQVLGRENYAGLLPIGVRVEADAWGFATCSFDLPRDPFLPHPDLASFTPCIIDEGNARLFEGKVMETPARGEPQPTISVAGRGTQYALDENPIEFAWKHSDLTEWRDIRDHPGYAPTTWVSAGTVNVGGGAISFGQGNGTVYRASTAQGVYLDLGPYRVARRIEIKIEQTNLAAGATFQLYVRGRTDSSMGDQAFGGNGQQLLQPSSANVWADSMLIMGVPSGSNLIGFDNARPWHSSTFYPPARQIAIFLNWSASGTATQEYMATISAINVYGDPAFGCTGGGNLRASDVVEHAVRTASVGISVPKQSARAGTYSATDDYGSELIAPAFMNVYGYPGDGPGMQWYRMRSSPGRLAPTLSSVASSLNQGGTPTYSDTGGPVLDGDPAGSAYASFPASPTALAWLQAQATNFPDPGNGRTGWSLIVWFRTSTAGNAAADWRALNNRIVASDVSAGSPPAGTHWWGVGLNSSGNVMGGVVTSGGLSNTTLSGNYADGQWHMLIITRNRFDGKFTIGVDGSKPSSVFESNYDVGSLTTAAHTPGASTGIYFATRNGGDVRFVGDLAEITWFFGELPIQAGYHIYQAARREANTSIKRTQLVLPGMATTAPRTARESIEAANAYHRYVAKVGTGMQLEYRSRPTVPKYALTAAAARRFSQTALTAGEEAYNRAIVAGRDGYDRPVVVERTAAHQPGAVFKAPDDVAWGNPIPNSPITGVGGYWLYQGDTGGSIVRDTTTFDTSPASIRMDPNPVSGVNQDAFVYGYFQGTFKRGRRYVLTVRLRPNSVANPTVLTGHVGNLRNGDVAKISGSWPAAGTWGTFTMDWVPRKDYVCGDPASGVAEYGADDAAVFQIWAPDALQAATTPKQFWIDTPALTIGVNSMLDRQGDLRTRTIEHNQTLTEAVATAICDAFLQTRSKQQLRGSIEVGPGDVRAYNTGESIHPKTLVEDTMEMIHIPSLVDPDTGAQGRDGLVVSVAYEPATERALLTVDNQADNFETMMQRLAMFS